MIKAKFGLSIEWIECMGYNLKVKYKFLRQLHRLQYVAQIWCSRQSSEVGNLLESFIKNLLRLPTYTLICLYLETDLLPLHLYTLQLHHKYVCEVLHLPDDLLTKK